MNSENYNNEKEMQMAYVRCEDFLVREERALSIFTRDSSLIFMPSLKTEEFILNTKEKILYIPVIQFVDKDLNENLMMWSIYRALALYNDWSLYPDKYLKRLDYFKNERENIYLYFIEKLQEYGITSIKSKFITNYIDSEFNSFIDEIDKYYSLLRVSEYCPVYKNKENIELINNELTLEGYNFINLSGINLMSFFSKAPCIFEKYSNKQIISNIEKMGEKYTALLYELNKNMFNKNIFSFYREKIIENILNNGGIAERDELTKIILLPSYIKLFREYIDKIVFNKNESENNLEEYMKDTKKTDDSLLFSKEEKEKILQEFKRENENISSATQDILSGKINLENYGVSTDDQKLFQMYANEVNAERNEMKNFWRKLIGDAKKEINIKNKNQIKGKLNIKSLINNYPDFVEAQRKGNFKNIKIFDKYILTAVPGILPENIDISFVVDNSGSMNSVKIEYARKALILAILSLNDFAKYLKMNADYLHQKISVNIETFLFGTNYYRVLKFDDKSDEKKKMAGEILSILRLEGSGGSTDDGSCLNNILDNIKVSEEYEIKKGKRVKIIFEITDGASSFPGIAKKAVSNLIDKNVEIYSIEIGRRDKNTEKIFEYIWNEDYNDKHGLFLGDKIDKLPEELIKIVSQNIKSIFSKNKNGY